MLSKQCITSMLRTSNLSWLPTAMASSYQSSLLSQAGLLSKPEAQKIDNITIVNGLPHITVTLPSRQEKCVFALKPISNTVGDFFDMLKLEDKGIDHTIIKNKDGVRIASRTWIQTLFDQEFRLHINDNEFIVEPPQLESLSKEELKKISDVKNFVSQLYEALNIDEFQMQRKQDLVKELEVLQKELNPLENQRHDLLQHAEDRTSVNTWVGLGLMSIQFGILARLTWWEYSWDIMEPVTYFVTYGTAITGYAYFVLTRQEYIYPDAADRTRLITFHKKAKKHRWNVNEYSKLKQGINVVEADLRRLRDPLHMNVPSTSNKDTPQSNHV